MHLIRDSEIAAATPSRAITLITAGLAFPHGDVTHTEMLCQLIAQFLCFGHELSSAARPLASIRSGPSNQIGMRPYTSLSAAR